MKTSLEIYVFAADESLIELTNPLALIDVDRFLDIVGTKFKLPPDSIKIPIAEAIPWLRSLPK